MTSAREFPVQLDVAVTVTHWSVPVSFVKALATYWTFGPEVPGHAFVVEQVVAMPFWSSEPFWSVTDGAVSPQKGPTGIADGALGEPTAPRTVYRPVVDDVVPVTRR